MGAKMGELIAGDWLDTLERELGKEVVCREMNLRVLFSQDVLGKGAVAKAVLRPLNTDELIVCVKAAVDAGVALLPRGGGMSYTSGYVPQHENSVIVDLGRMNRILEINQEDMFVTVEAGCTWQALYEELEETGLRTPFWGTLSGRFATVGGGVSQNSIFWGSGQFGAAADSVVSMDIVLADGSVISTGSAAHNNANAFHRHYGPDLTGLFIGDTGALGFKATVTLRLIPQRPVRDGLSFAADDAQSLIAFASDVSRSQVASEVFGFDPYLQAQRMKRESLATDVKALAGVMRSAGGIGKALKKGAKVAVAGRGYMKDVKFSLHVMMEETSEAAIKQNMDLVRGLAKKHGLRELEGSIPTILRANPFGPVNNMVGPNGERWVPVHGVLPHSRAQAVYDSLEAVFDEYRELIEQYEIGTGYLFATVGPNAFVLEPVFFWPDELNEWHREAVEDEHLQRINGFPANEDAREAVLKIRAALCEVFIEHGAVHMQIARAYPYGEVLNKGAWSFLKSVKQQLDPKGCINPGSLGLG